VGHLTSTTSSLTFLKSQSASSLAPLQVHPGRGGTPTPSQCLGHSVREVLKNSTPPPLFQISKGEGGSEPPESQPSPKSLNFLLILYFSRLFLEHVSWNCIFRAYTMIYWAKTGPFWHKNETKGGGVPVYCYTPVESLLQLRASPPFKAFILALGVQESTKNEKILPPL